MNAKKWIKQAALFSVSLSLFASAMPGVTHAASGATSSDMNASQLAASAPVAAQASATDGCVPYGPKPGYQYDPNTLMKLMGKPRTGTYGPFLSAHRGVWGTNLGLSPSGEPLQDAAENSITAIDNTAKLKFEMVELDVKEAEDGLVLMHDYTLGRTTTAGWDNPMYEWDVFNQITPMGDTPQYEGNPSQLTEESFGQIIIDYNPLVKMAGWTMKYLEDNVHLKIFDKYSSNSLGTMKVGGVDVPAVGEWKASSDTVPSLRKALQYIGDHYPGMTVVLDLRHLDEVKSAMDVIDQVKNCQGTPAMDWVILKPFANIFPDGLFGHNEISEPPAPNSLVGLLGFGALDYKWIPVVSNRLVEPNPPGEPSVIPCNSVSDTSPYSYYTPCPSGPDVSQIKGSILDYVSDWNNPSVVTIENGYNGDGSDTNPLKAAYDYATSYSTNMQSWRPADVRAKAPVVVNGKTVIGFNWKDDGMGAYPVYKETAKDYVYARRTAGILTVEDAPLVLKNELLTRDATQRAISKVVDWNQFDTSLFYKIVDATSGKVLEVPGNDYNNGAKVYLNDYNGSDAQLWNFKRVGSSSTVFHIIHTVSGQAMDIPVGGGPQVQLFQDNEHPNLEFFLDHPAQGGMFAINNVQAQHIVPGSDGYSVIFTPGTSEVGQWFVIPVYDRVIATKDLVISYGNKYEDDNAYVLPQSGNTFWKYKFRVITNANGTYTFINPVTMQVLAQPGMTYATVKFDRLQPEGFFNKPLQEWEVGSSSSSSLTYSIFRRKAFNSSDPSREWGSITTASGVVVSTDPNYAYLRAGFEGKPMDESWRFTIK